MERRSLPGVDAVLGSPEAGALCERFPRALVADAVRGVLDDARRRIAAGEKTAPVAVPAIVARAGDAIAALAAARPPRVVNATGVVLHTNLGRAPLAQAAIDAIAAAASSATALELDLASGERGERDHHLVPLLRELTGAEDAVVVNNNAAALLLAVNSLADRREVLVSRGELIEIGGSFRLPEILRKGGAILREVGTTNRTRAEDFAAAVGRRTAFILRAHPSNYRIEGFTERPALADLVALARSSGVPLVEDLGSGALVDLSGFGLPREPTPTESIRAGADLVTFSGDKLLGGPQAGIAVGRADLVAAMRRNPLRRALRLDKLAIAGLAATLALHRTARDLPAALPALGLLCRPLSALDAMATEAAALVREALGDAFSVEAMESEAEIGSGAQPAFRLPSRAVAVARAGWPPERIAALFRGARPPVVGRIAHGRFLLDLRGVARAEDLVPRASARATEEAP
ncbi:MAG TPA: L-seryl-tRNA(Sec) selenium transferase [Candidatus Binatia bacterium]|nr:L-seryl-tRNA(Sec) selenium transferase [Candidatus Binatia bacterium]